MAKSTIRDFSMLYEAVLSLKSKEECEAFFTDLFTITELQSATQRLIVADMLYHKKTCQYISDATGASTATVTRVNKCLNYGPGGYGMILKRLNNEETE